MVDGSSAISRILHPDLVERFLRDFSQNGLSRETFRDVEELIQGDRRRHRQAQTLLARTRANVPPRAEEREPARIEIRHDNPRLSPGPPRRPISSKKVKRTPYLIG